MTQISFKQLRSAVEGDAVAIRSRTALQPAGGPGDKVFPSSYAVVGNLHAPARPRVQESHPLAGWDPCGIYLKGSGTSCAY
jgi:CRISPR-associated protein Csb1